MTSFIRLVRLVRLKGLPCFLMLICMPIMAAPTENTTYDPWVISQVPNPCDFRTASGFLMCPRPYESCTVWEMFHKNDVEKKYPFYFSRIEGSEGVFFNSCKSQKTIQSNMVQATNSILQISKDNENGILFEPDADLSLAEQRITVGDEFFTVFYKTRVGYSGYFPVLKPGPQAIEINNKVISFFEYCATKAALALFGTAFGITFGSMGLVGLSYLAYRHCKNKKAP